MTVTKGWSEAYGLFLEGEADMVLSYTTSPAYHLIAEEDATKTRRSSTKAITCRSKLLANWQQRPARAGG